MDYSGRMTKKSNQSEYSTPLEGENQLEVPQKKSTKETSVPPQDDLDITTWMSNLKVLVPKKESVKHPLIKK